MNPCSRSASAFPADYRRVLEESNLPIEIATAIADRLDGPKSESVCDELCVAHIQDAERYRWLRNSRNMEAENIVGYNSEEQLDAAIDEAMRRTDATKDGKP